MYIDTHVHLNNPAFKDNVKQTIETARRVGVKKMLVIGYNHETNAGAISIAEQYDDVYASVGFHPTEAKDITDDDFSVLEQLLSHPRVRAVGECGLDFYWDKTHINKQIEIFEKQIKLAKKYRLPLVVHMRDASLRTLEVLQAHAPLKGVMHCYSGSLEMVESFVDTGMHISLGGPVTFKNAKVPKTVASWVPESRLLIETDAPYLAPHPYRGKQNTPAYLPLIAEAVAALRGTDAETIGRITSLNANQLFNLKD